MKILCPYCNQEYEVDSSLVGQKVECVCGHKWILREPMPQLSPARSLNDVFDKITVKNTINGFCVYQKHEDSGFYQYQQIADSRKHDPLDVAYEKAKEVCISGNPVPAVYREFFKICRKKNIADKKAKKYQAVIDRVELMLKLDKKQLETIWLSCSKTNPFVTKKEIYEHYSKITITDRKNLAKCKELLKATRQK